MRSVLSWACAALLFAATSHAAAADKKVKLSAEDQKVLALVNKARAGAKLPAVKAQATLCAVARSHAAAMAKKGKLEQSFDGKQPGDRLKAAGYDAGYSGSLIGVGSNDPTVVFKELLADKTCREQLLSRHFSEVGIGIADNGRGKVYYNIVLASPN